jgi:hypothetical protein
MVIHFNSQWYSSVHHSILEPMYTYITVYWLLFSILVHTHTILSTCNTLHCLCDKYVPMYRRFFHLGTLQTLLQTQQLLYKLESLTYSHATSLGVIDIVNFVLVFSSIPSSTYWKNYLYLSFMAGKHSSCLRFGKET